MKCIIIQFLLFVVIILSALSFADGAAAQQQEEGSCKRADDPLEQGGDDDDDDAPLLAITACTGEAGSRLVTALRDVYPVHRIRCIVRQGTTKSLDHLMNDLESVHYVDFMNVTSIAQALDGASAAYLNTPPSLDVLEMRQNMAKACGTHYQDGAAGSLKHIVLLGEAVDIAWYGFAKYWDDHKEGEDALQRTGIPLTVLHPAFFMEGFATHFGNPQTIIADDYFSRVGTAPVAYTSLEDVAVVTAKILMEGPDIHGWKSYNLINDVLTGDEVAAAMTKALGRKIEYQPLTPEEFKAGMVAGGVPDVMVEAYTVCVNKTGQGHFNTKDRGQLEELLGRKSLSLVEVLLSVKSKLSKDSTLDRATNK